MFQLFTGIFQIFFNNLFLNNEGITKILHIKKKNFFLVPTKYKKTTNFGIKKELKFLRFPTFLCKNNKNNNKLRRKSDVEELNDNFSGDELSPKFGPAAALQKGTERRFMFPLIFLYFFLNLG